MSSRLNVSPRPASKRPAVARAAARVIERLEGRTLFSVPTISVGDFYAAEGNVGTRTFSFPITLSAASDQTVTVQYATADGEATAPSDYVATAGTVTFAPGGRSA